VILISIVSVLTYGCVVELALPRKRLGDFDHFVFEGAREPPVDTRPQAGACDDAGNRRYEDEQAGRERCDAAYSGDPAN
jgi:hypothetical protein